MGRFDGDIGGRALAHQTFNQRAAIQLDHAQLNQGSKRKEPRSGAGLVANVSKESKLKNSM
jgi:hypothetical protein